MQISSFVQLAARESRTPTWRSGCVRVQLPGSDRSTTAPAHRHHVSAAKKWTAPPTVSPEYSQTAAGQLDREELRTLFPAVGSSSRLRASVCSYQAPIGAQLHLRTGTMFPPLRNGLRLLL